jgi:hypothetical protein
MPIQARQDEPFMRHRLAAPLAAAVASLCIGAAAAATPSQTFIPAPQSVPPAATGAIPAPPAAAAAPADASHPPPASEQWVEQQTAKVRAEVEARVARGDLTPDEAERLIGWRHWQLAQQAAGQAPAPTILERQQAVAAAPRVVPAYPPAYYAAPYPYYAPYGYARYGYYGPYGPRYYGYAPGIAVCAGGVGHHFAGSVCF